METLYIIKHKMSGMVDDHDVITNDPEAWIKKQNKELALDNFYADDKPKTLDEFHVNELDVVYF